MIIMQIHSTSLLCYQRNHMSRNGNFILLKMRGNVVLRFIGLRVDEYQLVRLVFAALKAQHFEFSGLVRIHKTYDRIDAVLNVVCRLNFERQTMVGLVFEIYRMNAAR